MNMQRFTEDNARKIGHGRGWRLTCRECGDNWAVMINGKAVPSPKEVFNSFRNEGWFIGHNESTDLCSDCGKHDKPLETDHLVEQIWRYCASPPSDDEIASVSVAMIGALELSILRFANFDKVIREQLCAEMLELIEKTRLAFLFSGAPVPKGELQRWIESLEAQS